MKTFNEFVFDAVIVFMIALVVTAFLSMELYFNNDEEMLDTFRGIKAASYPAKRPTPMPAWVDRD